MSKSLSSPTGIIELLDDPAINIRKIKSAVTDSGREIIFDEVNKPGVSNLLTILSALTGADVDSLVEEFHGRGYGDLKSAVADAVTEFATPYRNRTSSSWRSAASSNRSGKGADRARDVAGATLADVYANVGLARRGRRHPIRSSMKHQRHDSPGSKLRITGHRAGESSA